MGYKKAAEHFGKRKRNKIYYGISRYEYTAKWNKNLNEEE